MSERYKDYKNQKDWLILLAVFSSIIYLLISIVNPIEVKSDIVVKEGANQSSIFSSKNEKVQHDKIII